MSEKEFPEGLRIHVFEKADENKDQFNAIQGMLKKLGQEVNYKGASAIAPNLWLLVEDQVADRYVGFLAYVSSTVLSLYIEKDYRRKGIAAALVKILYENQIPLGGRLTAFYPSHCVDGKAFFIAQGFKENTFFPETGLDGSRISVITHYGPYKGNPNKEGDPDTLEDKPIKEKKRYTPRELPSDAEVVHIQRNPPVIFHENFMKVAGMCAEETQTPIFLDDCEVYVVAQKRSDKVLGFIVVERSYGGKDIKMAYVHPDHRRQGIGSVLVEQVVRFGVFQDRTFIVVPEEAKDVHEFFERLSFTVPEDPGWGTKVDGKFYMTTGMELNRVSQLEEDRKVILDTEQFVRWQGSEDVTLDGDFCLKDLKALIRFMENKGPGDANYVDHKDL